ncbi:hypothetical protein Daura_06545 [Dactylosporangium aurantiacum]|uniref:Uncharacterized protein n=1 Tax=Dactylosporangium aurantiacum TaxID=35754 RepID=A0A9Q9ME74_9ACTN|nr:DUF6615 family protein [Dactylosporangium aurantiacum]MDG6106108.1 hypothetical protein [Dactylosporangium aurantiacum]UWZ55853.1 hypothetical protein Daura_06545 [Dactylosporangium aurantiacum]
MPRNAPHELNADKNVTTVADTLDDLAAQTWHKITVGPLRGLTFGEESITDHNLFELDRLAPEVEVYKFDKSEEPTNGADFEWWIGSSSIGWLGIRFQAKKLDDGSYAQLGHRVRGQRQYHLLLEQARQDNVWAFYCFYNGWDGPWPDGVPNITCPRNLTPTWDQAGTSPCTHAALQDFGCAIAPAAAVASRHAGEPRKGRLAMEEYLQFSRPWSHLFRDRSSRLLSASPSIPIIESLLGDWVLSAVRPAQNSSMSDTPYGQTAMPPEQGIHASLPPWLQARRVGASNGEGNRPSVAVVFDLS